MTREQRDELMRIADQADAHGRREVAQWYRCWASTGRQIGPKPQTEPRKLMGEGAPVC